MSVSRAISRAVILCAFCVVEANAANYTLSRQSLLALTASSSSGAVASMTPREDGVEYLITFPSSKSEVQFTYAGDDLQQPLSGEDSFMLQITVVSVAPNADAPIVAGAMINGKAVRYKYRPVELGAAFGKSAVCDTATDALKTTLLGFTVFPRYTEPRWPTGGGQVRVLVSPAPNALPIQFAAYTLSQKGLQELKICSVPACRYARSSSVTSATPNGDGVEYLISFSENQATAIFTSSSGDFVGRPLSGRDSFRLRFTLLSATPNAGAIVGVGALITNTSGGYSYMPQRLGGSLGSTVVTSSVSQARRLALVGFTVFISQADASSWPESGGQIRLLVSPVPDTAPINEKAYYTLNKEGLVSLDEDRATPQDGSAIVSAVPSGDGIEYVIDLAGRSSGVYRQTSASGILEGAVLSGWSAFALRFTLLSATPDENAEVAVGAVIAGGFFPFVLGGAKGNTVIAETSSAMTYATRLGFVVYTNGRKGWTDRGGQVRLLVSPVAGSRPVCGISLASSGRFFGAGGGDGTASVKAFEGCRWTALGNVPWLATTSGGSGNGKVSYEVSPNTGARPRTGIVAVGSRQFKVSQAGTLTGEETDPAGDVTSGVPDLVFASAAAAGGNLSITVRLAPGTFDIPATNIVFSLDTDQDPATGHPGISGDRARDVGIVGSEYVVHIGAGQPDGTASLQKYDAAGASFKAAGTFPVKLTADSVEVAIPLSALGNDDGAVNFKATVAIATPFSTTGLSPILDVLPDLGLPPCVSTAPGR